MKNNQIESEEEEEEA